MPQPGGGRGAEPLPTPERRVLASVGPPSVPGKAPHLQRAIVRKP